MLVHKTKRSGLRIGAAMDHLIDGPDGVLTESRAFEDGGLVSVATPLKPGETLRIIKFVAYGWSAERSLPAVRDQVWAALSGARQATWEGLQADQRAFLDDFWGRADVEVDGDTEVQQAVRFALFHVMQAGARGERRPIPAKGLTGPGYDGHAFWDTESFVLPVLDFTAPDAAASALRWRHGTLPLAKERAAQLGLAGAAFPWRTIAGQECSGYWPAGSAAFHVNADIADAVVRYVDATGDDAFEAGPGIELLTETARLWRSLGHHDARGSFHIDGVTGPDEYSAIADDNIYTNLMAKRNLIAAADAADRHPDRARAARRRRRGDGELAGRGQGHAHPATTTCWACIRRPRRFTRHQEWDFAATKPEQYPLLLHFTYFDLYRKQVVKQADLVLAMFMCGAEFTAEQKARNFEYYEPITVRDSSLSASTQAIIAAEVGHLDLAYDYLGEAALMDLRDLEHNTRDGVHIASLAGAWLALVCGFGGLRHEGGTLSFAPVLPQGLTKLAFSVLIKGNKLRVQVTRRVGQLRAVRRRAAHLQPSRRSRRTQAGPARAAPDPADQAETASGSAARPRADPAPGLRLLEVRGSPDLLFQVLPHERDVLLGGLGVPPAREPAADAAPGVTGLVGAVVRRPCSARSRSRRSRSARCRRPGRRSSPSTS